LSDPQRWGRHEWGIVLFGGRPQTRDDADKPDWLRTRFSVETGINASLDEVSTFFKEEKKKW
jgi:hypothetical protein